MATADEDDDHDPLESLMNSPKFGESSFEAVTEQAEEVSHDVSEREEHPLGDPDDDHGYDEPHPNTQ